MGPGQEGLGIAEERPQRKVGTHQQMCPQTVGFQTVLGCQLGAVHVSANFLQQMCVRRKLPGVLFTVDTWESLGSTTMNGLEIM